MTTRRAWAGLFGVVLAAGVALADKPTGLPINPLVEGRESTHLARQYHDPDQPTRPADAVFRPVSPKPLHEWVEAWLALLTFPLGTVPVGK